MGYGCKHKWIDLAPQEKLKVQNRFTRSRSKDSVSNYRLAKGILIRFTFSSIEKNHQILTDKYLEK